MLEGEGRGTRRIRASSWTPSASSALATPRPIELAAGEEMHVSAMASTRRDAQADLEAGDPRGGMGKIIFRSEPLERSHPSREPLLPSADRCSGREHKPARAQKIRRGLPKPVIRKALSMPSNVILPVTSMRHTVRIGFS